MHPSRVCSLHNPLFSDSNNNNSHN